MVTSEAMHTAELCDADLVAESLSGDRDAFGQIVERYQTLTRRGGFGYKLTTQERSTRN